LHFSQKMTIQCNTFISEIKKKINKNKKNSKSKNNELDHKEQQQRILDLINNRDSKFSSEEVQYQMLEKLVIMSNLEVNY
jgi:hypothetical protein